MNCDQVSDNLRSGIYNCTQPIKNAKPLRSMAWDVCHWVVDDNGERVSTVGTTNLLRHKDECLNTVKRKSLAGLSKNAVETIKTSVNEKVMQFVSQDIRAFRTTSGPGFEALADKLITIGHRYGPLKAKNILPHRTTIPHLVNEEAENKRLHLKTRLVGLQSQGVSITLDLWTEDITKCHYLGMNVHFISEGVLNEATLCVKELDEISANAENIHVEIISILEAFEIDIDNVIFVTDRGGEIVAPLKDYAERLNCAAHLLKNIVDEMLKKIGDQNPVNTLLDNCRALIGGAKSLECHVVYLNSIKKAQESSDLMDFLDANGESDLLTDIDNDLLDELIEFLEPFYEATLQFEAKTKPTIHYVALYRLQLQEHLAASRHDSFPIREMNELGLAYMEEKWVVDDIRKKAVFFHPKLKSMNMFTDGKELIEQIRKEAAVFAVADDTDEEELPPPRKRRRVTGGDRIIEEFANSNFADAPIDEVQQYLNSYVVVPESGKIDLCQYWFENRELFPALYKLSLKYLCVPASSATAESKFSLAGFLINEKRVLMRPTVVDNILVLKSIYDSEKSPK
ncbi:hypothetical protein HA402_005646 [Bradysia odoriphaga]|nr:hypothetical protein HA402_005646 [Bradysia odoriphaga]